IYWKDVWLKRPGELARRHPAPAGAACCSVDRLHQQTREAAAPGTTEAGYSCQATQLSAASEPLPWWDFRQYLYDVRTRNHSLARTLRVLWLSSLRWWLRYTPRGYRIVRGFTNWMHRVLTGRPAPDLAAKIPDGAPTPTGRLNLRPGETVKIKSQQEIEQTLDQAGRNRGLSFDPEEMAPYCGGVYEVRLSLSRIIDEKTGKMLHLKQPCIALEGGGCNPGYTSPRPNCPRAPP